MAKKRTTPARLGIIFAKVHPRIRKRIERQAAAEGISLSDVVRRAVMRDLAQLDAKSG